MAFLKSIWKNNSKHKKLSEELALQMEKEAESEQNPVIENENDVLTFKVKYLGSTVVEKLQGENINTESVKNIIKVAKASRKKMQRVQVAISLKGIVVSDLQGNDILNISIYRISNCSTDPTHRQVFSFVSTDSNETMECHAFICSKRKLAETVTLAIAHSFSTAYKAWRIMPEKEQTTLKHMKEDALNNINNRNMQTVISNIMDERNTAISDAEEKLIDFDDDVLEAADALFFFEPSPAPNNTCRNPWVCFDDDFVPENRSAFKTDMIMA